MGGHLTGPVGLRGGGIEQERERGGARNRHRYSKRGGKDVDTNWFTIKVDRTRYPTGHKNISIALAFISKSREDKVLTCYGLFQNQDKLKKLNVYS